MRLVDEMKMKLVPRGEQVAQRQQIEVARRTQEIVGRHLRRPSSQNPRSDRQFTSRCGDVRSRTAL
jgi:hypothetical protein